MRSVAYDGWGSVANSMVAAVQTVRPKLCAACVSTRGWASSLCEGVPEKEHRGDKSQRPPPAATQLLQNSAEAAADRRPSGILLGGQQSAPGTKRPAPPGSPPPCIRGRGSAGPGTSARPRSRRGCSPARTKRSAAQAEAVGAGKIFGYGGLRTGSAQPPPRSAASLLSTKAGRSECCRLPSTCSTRFTRPLVLVPPPLSPLLRPPPCPPAPPPSLPPPVDSRPPLAPHPPAVLAVVVLAARGAHGGERELVKADGAGGLRVRHGAAACDHSAGDGRWRACWQGMYR